MGGCGLFGPVAGVAAALEFCEGKFAGWKRGRDGSLSCAAVPEECWRECGEGRIRRACDGMARDSIFGDSGELVGGMVPLRSDRGDMWWWWAWGEVLVNESTRAKSARYDVCGRMALASTSQTETERPRRILI